MNSREDFLAKDAPGFLLRWEAPLVSLVVWLSFVSIPTLMGDLGLAWDTLNHHIYLGWTAESPRFDRDFVAAGYQALTYPYMYWPIYKMAVNNWSGMAAGVVLATLHAVNALPVWMIAKTCLPGRTRFELVMRLGAIALAFLSVVLLSVLTTTITDVLSSAPLIWAIAIGLKAISAPQTSTQKAVRRMVILSGLCAGVAVGAKLSNGVLVVCMPLLWAMSGERLRDRLEACLLGGVATVFTTILVFAPWGLQLWEQFGNPVYPFFDHWFAPLRMALGRGA